MALPAAELTLLDWAAKKCAFLEAAVEAAGLAVRAHVVCARSELHAVAGQPGREAYAVVLARAVAPLPALWSWRPRCSRGAASCWPARPGAAVREEGPRGEAVAKLCGLAAGPVVPLPRSPLDDAVCAVYEKVAAHAEASAATGGPGRQAPAGPLSRRRPIC